MYKLVALAVAAVSIASANPVQEHRRDDFSQDFDADFDDLVVRGSGHPIGHYKGLSFSNLYVEDASDLDGEQSYRARPLSGNNVAVFQDPAGRGAPLPSIKAQHRGGVTDTFDLKSLNWGCATSSVPCELVVTGHRNGKRVASATFSVSTDNQGSVKQAVFDDDFSGIDKVKFHPHHSGSARRATVDAGVTWLDDIEYTVYPGNDVPVGYGSNPLPTTSETVSSIEIITDLPVPTNTCFGDVCFDGIDDCGQTFGGCFDACITPWPVFTPPNECLSTSGGPLTITIDSSSTDITMTTASSVPTATESSLPTETGSLPIDHSFPLSTDGRCGDNIFSDVPFNERCSDDVCCSIYGWCGGANDRNSPWCTACQPGFGFCSPEHGADGPFADLKFARNSTGSS
ncbi:hypothetical protein BJ166DRAFT_498040 [Pestalotiopsis sp. NC0098]|nr:hypothetical protein BJ166DRAFT_498040 [Pestalotiopsis sp. NC0098]